MITHVLDRPGIEPLPKESMFGCQAKSVENKINQSHEYQIKVDQIVCKMSEHSLPNMFHSLVIKVKIGKCQLR